MQRQIGREGDTSVSQAPRTKTIGAPSMAMQIKGILFLCLSHWYWFVLALAITFGYAYYYLKKTVPLYERTASILIKSEDKTSDNSALVELGLVQINTNLTNEILSMKTAAVASEIVRRLNLDVEYRTKGTFHDNVVYGVEIPLSVRFLDIDDNTSASFNLRLAKQGKITLSEFMLRGQSIEGDVTTGINDTTRTPVGTLVVVPNSAYTSKSTCDIDVVRSPVGAVSASVQGRINPYLRNQSASIIDISFRDVSPARAEDILNTLIAVYNENWVKDRNQKTVNTNQFIKDRLAFIEDELGQVEQTISNWKSSNLILDVGASGGLAQNQANAAQVLSEDIDNQIYMTRHIRNYLTDGNRNGQLLPANSGITNPSIEAQIAEYNSVLLQRNNHLANSSLQNPIVRDMDEQLSALRGSIIQSLDYELTMLQTKQDNARKQYSEAISKVASNPQQARHLLSVERQQMVKEQLYLFLLQKREENELSQAFAAYNSQLIEPPHGSPNPVAPVPKSAWLIATLLGLAIPGGIIAMREILNTKVRGRKDLDELTLPYVGDIPQAHMRKKKNSGKKDNIVPEVLVKEKNRDMINEAFRVVRTNLEFMLGFDSDHHIVMLTSMDPGSGKTFITANLATALAIKEKKVLVIDLDLRKGSFSQYVNKPRKGVSNYLNGGINDFHEFIVKLGPVDVMPCGSLPPNPSELLFSSRFKELLEEAREEYDYIFLDTPPVEIVADAAIVNRFVDLTLFVVRIGVMERGVLAELEQWYEEKKYRNLAVILNGVVYKGTYGYHKYGYHRYGYHNYGYGYGE